MKLEKAKLEQKRKYEKKIDGKKDQNINAKLSKLVITKFKGIPADWLCLTGNFHLRTEITKVNRHLGEVRPPERSGNRWHWFEERATRLLNPRNKRMR